MKKSEALQQRRKLLKLLEQWTRAEIMARLGRFDNLEFADFALLKTEKEDEIRKLIFGTSDILVLAARWNLPKDNLRRKHKIKKSGSLQKQVEGFSS